MKKFLIISLLLLINGFCAIRAQTLKGGWMQCRHVVDLPLFNQSVYAVTLYAYGSGSPSAAGGEIKIYDASNGEPVQPIDSIIGVSFGRSLTNHFSYCANTTAMNNRYSIRIVDYILKFPMSTKSYLIAYSERGHDPTFVNISGPEGTGILYTANILGRTNGIDYHANSSPVFDFTDTVSVCRNTQFTQPLIVTDIDGDSLSYRFGEAIDAPYDTTSPPLFPIVYNAPFSGLEPMGSSVTINPVTGLISGTAPDMPGGYLIAVYVDEWRNGVLINTTRKESMIKVVNCPFAAPLLKPLYSSCRVNTFTFKNELTCPTVTSWLWDFGDPTTTTDTSTQANPTYTYPGLGTYILKLKVSNNNGYIDSAKSIVKILDAITVKLGADTAMCTKDTITLKPVSEAVNFLWKESGGGRTLNNYNVQYPKASPVATSTTYYVTGSLNNCRDSAKITVYASPYPKANAGTDSIICIGKRITLNGSITGAFFNWSPTETLHNITSLQPEAYPQKSTRYVLSVRDTFYCPKTVRDTVLIIVVPKFNVNAGNDALIVFGQPYQLNAVAIGNTEIVKFMWQPSPYLNYNNIPNPVATINISSTYTIPFTVTATTVVGGCSVTDEVVLKLFKTGPDILVPNAFTPNGDGNNDVLKPILIGMKNLDYFSIYNRFGKLIFTTSVIDKGWDGSIKSVKQSTGTYVFIAQGTDYLGKKIFRKGSVVLLR